MTHDYPNLTNNLAINFCNSRILKQNKLLDIFDSLESVRHWLEVPIDKQKNYNQQLSVMYSCLDDSVELDSLLEIREDFVKVLSEIVLNNNTEIVIGNIETYISKNPFTIIFVKNDPVFIPVSKGIVGIKVLLYLSLTELIKSQEINKLAKCANEGCPLFFINQTGRRKWCSMKVCGNRSKVDTFLNKSIKEDRIK